MGGRSCWRSWLQDLEELPTPRLEECQAKILHHPVHPKLGSFILHLMILNDLLDCGGAEKKGADLDHDDKRHGKLCFCKISSTKCRSSSAPQSFGEPRTPGDSMLLNVILATQD